MLLSALNVTVPLTYQDVTANDEDIVADRTVGLIKPCNHDRQGNRYANDRF